MWVRVVASPDDVLLPSATRYSKTGGGAGADVLESGLVFFKAAILKKKRQVQNFDSSTHPLFSNFSSQAFIFLFLPLFWISVGYASCANQVYW